MRLLLLLLLCAQFCFAQQTSQRLKTISNSCSTASLKKNLFYLAGNKLQGRMMGSHGDTLAAKYVAASFKLSSLQAPYGKVNTYYQSVGATQKIGTATITINGADYKYLDGWMLYLMEQVHLTKVKTVYANQATIAEFYNDLPKMNVREKGLILNNRLITAFLSHGIDSLESVLSQEGALAVIWSGRSVRQVVERQRSRQFLPQFVQPNAPPPHAKLLPEISLTPQRLKDLLSRDSIDVTDDGSLKNAGDKIFFDTKGVIELDARVEFKEIRAPNVIGLIKGTDTSLASVVICAHHDHDGVNGKDVYFGAVDNASGTVAIMEIAAMMNRAVKLGLRPKRTIVFASFTGEERGLLGSFWYVNHPVYPLAKTYAVLNIDMFGRVDTLHIRDKSPDSANYAYILVKDTLGHGLRQALFDANTSSTALTLDTYYENPKYMMRRLSGSDQFPFYQKGVPFVRIDCGFCAEYHKPTDTPDKINFALLTRQTQLAFHTLWNIANR